MKSTVRLTMETLERRDCPSVYYVSPKGHDTAAGTVSSPWRTLQHAADMVAAGDTVHVGAGTYSAGFVLGWDTPAAGTPQAPISFLAAAGVTITGRNSKTADGIDLEPGCNYIDIIGFTINNAGTITRAGIRDAGGTNVVIENNHCDRCGTWGIFTSHADDVVIKDNVASRVKTQHGIYVSNACVNPVVENNTCWGNYACGIHMNGDLSQGGTGLITGALVANNIIHDNGVGGGSAINCDGVQNSVIENNLLYNNHASGISLFDQDAAAGAINNIVVNNTIVMAKDARWAINIKNGSTGNTVLNNILLDNNPSHGSVNIAADSLSGFTSDYNIVVDRFNPDDGNVSNDTLAQWQSQTGQDQHSHIAAASALFANLAKNNYHLKAGSPAIDAGTSTDAPKSDLSGKPRPAGKGYDIGCYEFQGS
jgi:hypothetical protein